MGCNFIISLYFNTNAMKRAKIITIAIVTFLLAIQLIRIDKTVPSAPATSDYIIYNQIPAEVASILKRCCYDCHSYETRYPWYAEVAPFSWAIKQHVNNARQSVNFSIWKDYISSQAVQKEQNCIEEIDHNEMPLVYYTWFHQDAKLNEHDKQTLTTWFNAIYTPADTTATGIKNEPILVKTKQNEN